MAKVRLETQGIVDRASFHDVCAATFGFPDFYGRNMDAWIDCMTHLEEMTRFDPAPGEMLMIEVADFQDFQSRLPQLANDLTECTAFTNRRFDRPGEEPRLALVLC